MMDDMPAAIDYVERALYVLEAQTRPFVTVGSLGLGLSRITAYAAAALSAFGAKRLCGGQAAALLRPTVGYQCSRHRRALPVAADCIGCIGGRGIRGVQLGWNARFKPHAPLTSGAAVPAAAIRPLHCRLLCAADSAWPLPSTLV